MKRPDNSSIQRAFPHPQEPFDNWFDNHPILSGAIAGAVFAVILVIGLF